METAQNWRAHYVAQLAPLEQTQSHDHRHDYEYQ
jgi:hypothetical protein